MNDERRRVPRGRLRRLGKAVGLSARVGTSVLAQGVKSALGGDGSPKVEAAKRVLETLGEMKGVALKMGQVAVLKGGAVPPELRDVLSHLFAGAPPLDFEEIRAQIERELGRGIHECFASFEETPFAAASIGQVHRATLLGGEQVAVKVQYPGVEEAVHADLQNLSTIVKTLGLGSNIMDNQQYIEELRREFVSELDYLREQRHIEAFAQYVAPWPDLALPRTYPELSSGRLLVLEYFSGPTLDAYSKHAASVPMAERFRVASQLVRAVYGPFFRHKVMQTDTHPGNYVVCADGRLGLLDFGNVKRYSEPFYRCYRTAMQAGLRDEPIELLPLVQEGGFTVTLNPQKAEALLHELAHIVGKPLKGYHDWSHDTVMNELRALSMKRLSDLLRMRPPPEGIFFYRAVAGISHNLRNLQVAGDFRPLFRELLEAPHELLQATE